MAEKIKIMEGKVIEFYDEFGSKHFQLQSKTLEKYGELKLDIYFKSIGFVATLTSVIGIIAGFGFTAFSFIESKTLFFIGEIVLFYGIFKGLVWVQNIYNKEFKSLEDEVKKHVAHYEVRNAAFEKIYNQFVNSAENEFDADDFKNLQKIDQDSLILFKPKKEDKESPPLVIYSKEVYTCLLVGTILLFSSFFILDLIRFLVCYIYAF